MTEQTGQEPAQQNDQQTEQQQGTPGQEPAQQEQPAPGNQEGMESLPQWARDEIRSVRNEAAQHRTQRNEHQQQLDVLKQSIGQALGLTQGDEPDPEQLSNELSQMSGKYRQERLKNAFYQAANKHGADSELAWSHLYAAGAFEDLDVEAQDFGSTVEGKLTEALEKQPKLKADYQSEASAPRRAADMSRQSQVPRGLDAQIAEARGNGNYIVAERLEAQKKRQQAS